MTNEREDKNIQLHVESDLPVESNQALAEQVRNTVMDLLEKHDDKFLVVAQSDESGSWIGLDSWVEVQHEDKKIRYNLSITLESKDGNLTKEVVTYSEPQPHFSWGEKNKPTCKITFFPAVQSDEVSENGANEAGISSSPRVVISADEPIMPVKEMLDMLRRIDSDPTVKLTAGRSSLGAKSYKEHKASRQRKPFLPSTSI